MSGMERDGRDRPWLFRTYAGYGTPALTNRRFKSNLAKGQTGLSIAFDLPTQTGYDSDDAMARGEVGVVGVPIGHLGDMRTLLDGIPLQTMNTSMTINATAVWLLALYVAAAEAQGAPSSALAGTTQNDILKEYLSRGTYIFPPEPSIRLTTDLIAWTLRAAPRWNPINVCSYHLQEAGADPVLEVAFALANAIAVLDAVRASPQTAEGDIAGVLARMSFFCNAGIRFIEETCKMRSFGLLWERIGRERYGVTDARALRFRYGVQVNSLGLTSEQPENNVYRVLLEMLAVTQSRRARARAVQLPAWNEALGLPRAWDQQWSLRAQQILAYETDLLEHDDIFDGSRVVEAKTAEIADAAWAELEKVLEGGGSLRCLPYMKGRLVEAHARRRAAVEAGEMVVVGLNRYTETEPSPLLGGLEELSYERVDARVEGELRDGVARWRRQRDASEVRRALDRLRRAAEGPDNLVPVSIDAARAGVTTGEWAGALRDVFGEYRAPTGLERGAAGGGGAARSQVRERVAAAAARAGVERLRMLVAKPGLDGHSNAAEQISLAARDAGFEVVYQGIRLTPEQIARTAADEDVHVVGISILSGAHRILVPEILERLRAEGLDTGRVPVIVGGTIPDDDARELVAIGVARVYTPRDFDVARVLGEIADLVGAAAAR
ncbi:MAG TPA: protein meaA [Actinomycetota bacterium]|nr:protein meaA [Actinomycetota bacterium]